MKIVAIAGGSGLIGRSLGRYLNSKGYTVFVLGRHAQPNGGGQEVNNYFTWDPDNHIVPEEIGDARVIINLAGANLGARRWTKAYKKEILYSRINSTRSLVDFINNNGSGQTQVLINASASGYYGFNYTSPRKEDDLPGEDYLSQVCVAWEREAAKINSTVRLVIYRFGTILSSEGGALPELARPIKLFAGAPLGSGKQFLSWIHFHDLCSMISACLEDNSFEGIYNAVSPNPVENERLMEEIAHALKRTILLPAVPSWFLELILGEFATYLTGQNLISAEKILQTGFRFKYPDIKSAINNLFSNS